MKAYSHYTRDRNLLLVVYFLFYYAVLLGFFLDDRLLFQYRPVFFNYNRDLTELWLIATGLPRWMIGHPASFAIADMLAFLLPCLLIRYGRRGSFSPWPGILFLCYLALYLLLADIFWQVHHEPFILLLLMAFAWIAGKPERFYSVMSMCRYYFLYAFVSAAIWKLARGAVFNSQEMSRILLLHHTDLLTGSCTSLTCRAYSWLIAHPALSQACYICGTLVEAVFVVGFFTRRWDRLLIVLAVLFVIADLLLMRIPYWTILIGVVPLWLRPSAAPSKEKKIVLYETTHHENLPALLDLCEAQFNQAAVFLRESSYHNVIGEGSPEQRWPHTDFFIQTTSCSNRRFIGQLFRFIRRHGYTHLHLCTLDNNLLYFAVRLTFIGPVHLSLTVHEVNEYFSRSCKTLRDWTETIAKRLLHGQIRHYHVFLPAMAEGIRQRLPGAAVVFIPSRFYRGRYREVAGTGAAERMVAETGTGAAERMVAGTVPFRIVIPGSLDPNRRNYGEVIATLSMLSYPVELVLLGDACTGSGARILADLQSAGGVTIRHFSGYIPESVYEEELAHAHLIWSPLNIHKRGSRHTPETYGLTTASGLTADMLLGNIPALVPADLVIPESFRAAIFSYGSSGEAREIIGHLIEDPAAYAALREKIHRAFSYFSRENFSEAFKEIMQL